MRRLLIVAATLATGVALVFAGSLHVQAPPTNPTGRVVDLAGRTVTTLVDRQAHRLDELTTARAPFLEAVALAVASIDSAPVEVSSDELRAAVHAAQADRCERCGRGVRCGRERA